MGKRTTQFTMQEQKQLALWAADCAEHVLPYFEERYPKDHRPRQAIAAARAWVRGDILMMKGRVAASAAHAAARQAKNEVARFAARAAGHAAGTAHAPGHSIAAAAYAVKAVTTASDFVTKERAWQRRRLPKNLHSSVDRVIRSLRRRTASARHLSD